MFRKKHGDVKPAPELDRETRIADMNIDGMPWHLRSFNDRFKKGGRRTSQSSAQNTDRAVQNNTPLSGKETWSLMINAVLAALAIGAIFLGAVFLFILFCIYVWFR